MAKSTVPKGGAMRLASDVWEVLGQACSRKGMTPSDRRAAAEAIIRSYALAWAGDSPQASTAKPSLTGDAAPAVINVLDAL